MGGAIHQTEYFLDSKIYQVTNQYAQNGTKDDIAKIMHTKIDAGIADTQGKKEKKKRDILASDAEGNKHSHTKRIGCMARTESVKPASITVNIMQ